MNKLINELEQIIRWPSKPIDKDLIIKHLAKQFSVGKKYKEV